MCTPRKAKNLIRKDRGLPRSKTGIGAILKLLKPGTVLYVDADPKNITARGSIDNVNLQTSVCYVITTKPDISRVTKITIL